MPSADSGVVSMSFAGLRIATFQDAHYRSKLVRHSDSVSSRTTSSLSRRRSVSSMKGLLPLTLSPSSSSTWSHLPVDEDMGERVDDYFPEILAHDLALSEEVFTARDMTAGAPIASLSFDDKAKAKSAAGHNKIALSLPYHATSARVQSLGAIEERDSMISFLDQRETKSDDAASDEMDSFSGTDTSGDMAPPSFRFRNHSVVTAATSLASESWKPSLKCSPPPDDAIQSSWIDNDSDGEDEDDIHQYGLVPLSPRPPTPPESDGDHGSNLKKIDSSGLENYSIAPLHRKSHSVSGGSPISSPRRQLSVRSVRDALKSPPTMNVTQVTQELKSRSQLPRARALEQYHPLPTQPRNYTTHHKSRLPDWPVIMPRGGFAAAAEPSPVSEEFPESDDESLPPPKKPSWDRTNSVYIRPSPPPSPLPSVQAWLNGSLQPYASTYQHDDLAKVVPLPPNVIETLRVSIACFPETMLLCSSLSVETIRSYSKKVRHPGADLLKALPPVSPTQTTRKSIWRKVVSKRSSQTLDQKPRQLRSSNGNNLQSSSSTSLETPKPWAPLKNVFGCCSDYICDALYAHIVTYNYISALVARCPPPPRAKRPHANGHTGAQNEDIPKKAATLLGLGGSPDQTLAGVNRFAKRFSTPFGNWAKEEMVAAQSSTAANQDNAVRNIQAGLLRCISRLTATAKLMAESGSGEERMVEMDAEDTDMLLMRSLCEIVRMAEEAT